MSTLYVVKRPFRSMGKYFGAGTILESLQEVKLGKIKFNEGKIVLLPEDPKQLQQLKLFLKIRQGVDFEEILAARDSKASDVAEPELKQPTPTPGTEPAKPTETMAKPTPAKVVPTATKHQMPGTKPSTQ